MLNRLVKFAKAQCRKRLLLTLWFVDGASQQGNIYFAHVLSPLTVKEFFHRDTTLTGYLGGAAKAG